jgi:hypothetical protein
MLDYPPKILMAFGETFSEEKGEFSEWLLQNGYQELAALSSAIKGSREANMWLIKNKFPHFAAFDEAIGGKMPAYNWLLDNDKDILALFVDAINNRMEALAWFKKREMEIFIHLSRKIRNFRENQTFDYHKLHF